MFIEANRIDIEMNIASQVNINFTFPPTDCSFSAFKVSERICPMGTVDGTVRLISEIVFTFLEGIEIVVPGTSCPVNPSSAV